MMKGTLFGDAASYDIYAAAHQGLSRSDDAWLNGFDVVWVSGEGGWPVPAGADRRAVMKNVTLDRFVPEGDLPENEGEFAGMCLDVFGLVKSD